MSPNFDAIKPFMSVWRYTQAKLLLTFGHPLVPSISESNLHDFLLNNAMTNANIRISLPNILIHQRREANSSERQS